MNNKYHDQYGKAFTKGSVISENLLFSCDIVKNKKGNLMGKSSDVKLSIDIPASN